MLYTTFNLRLQAVRAIAQTLLHMLGRFDRHLSAGESLPSVVGIQPFRLKLPQDISDSTGNTDKFTVSICNKGGGEGTMILIVSISSLHSVIIRSMTITVIIIIVINLLSRL